MSNNIATNDHTSVNIGETYSRWMLYRVQQAAKLCKSLSDFRAQYYDMYMLALERDWIDDVTKHMIDSREIRAPERAYSYCYQLAKQSGSLTQFMYDHPLWYFFSENRGWHHTFFNAYKLKTTWSHEDCIDAAKGLKHSADFKAAYPEAYIAVQRGRWYRTVFAHMPKRMLESAAEEGFKRCKLIAYGFECAQRTLASQPDDPSCSPNTDDTSPDTMALTREACETRAQSFSSLEAFMVGDRLTFDTAYQNGWIVQICARHFVSSAA